MKIALEGLDESVQYFFNATNQPVVIIDLKGEVYQFNDPFSFLLGNEKIHHMREILCYESMNKLEEILDQIAAHGKANYKITLNVKVKQMHKKTTIDLFFDQKIDRAVMLLSTPSMSNEDDFSYNRSATKIEQMAASVVHEIRNPLTTLKGFTQLLKMRSNTESINYLNIIEDEIKRMEDILSEMLTICKSTTIEMKPLAVEEIIDQIIQVISPKAVLDRITIIQKENVHRSLYILGNKEKLKQLFLNVFKNAMESMFPGGTMTVTIESCTDDQVNIIVSDTGKGITEENLQQIFMPYFTTKASGTGLGMPFVLQVIEEHTGTISVSSEVEKGTSFLISFPTVQVDV